jgi:hypothetical protein
MIAVLEVRNVKRVVVEREGRPRRTRRRKKGRMSGSVEKYGRKTSVAACRLGDPYFSRLAQATRGEGEGGGGKVHGGSRELKREGKKQRVLLV